MRIALEEHFVIDEPAHVERWETLIPNVPQEIAERIKMPLADLGERRIEAMTKANIDFAVLSNVGTVQGFVDGNTAMKIAQQANDRLARAVQDHPDHFAGFATTPLQNPRRAQTNLSAPCARLG